MKSQVGTISRTGDTCPVTGNWQVKDDPESQTTLWEGELMPAYYGRSITWELMDNA